jgi:hypothetical protein
MKSLRIRISVLVVAIGLLATTASAATFSVNDDSTDTADSSPGDGVCETALGNNICTLRAAIGEANVLVGTDTISFDTAIVTVQLAAVLPSITTTIIINGGSGVTVSGDATNFTFRAFTVTNTGSLSLDNLTVTNAKDTLGGGLLNQTGGTVSLTNCNFSGNSTTLTGGGGIFNAGMMTMSNTVVIVNSAANQGGGIFNSGTGVLTLTDCTVSFNDDSGIGGGGIGNAGLLTINRSTIRGNLTNGNGGGIFTLAGTVNLTNSTVSFNSAFANNGGGIFNGNGGTVTITNGTITDVNQAVVGGGIYNDFGAGNVVNLRNTIVAGNNGTSSAIDVSGNYDAPAYSLIGKSDGSTGFANGVNGNIVGTIATPIDPLLTPIANNGGATETYALMPGSPAANNGNLLLAVDSNGQPLTTDQRGVGFPRVVGNRADIGSFESLFIPTAAGFSVGGRVITAEGRAISNARLVMVASTGESRTSRSNPFGYYRFADVSAGETYVISVSHKLYYCAPQVLTVTEDIKGLNFIAKP